MKISHAKDLAQECPRSPRLRLHEYVIMGRTIDKCRAFLQGTLGEFHFDCPLDNMLFGFKNVTGGDFKARVETGATDEDIAIWFDRSGISRSAAEVRKWSGDVEAYKPYDDPEKQDWFIGVCEPLGLDPKTVTLFDYLEADDAQMRK